ncbi:MAG: LysM peptidoglycan-binding domain-containing protein [Firmicutes bacterium]|nr:LysM peptidoglycan-binding domain-containing protein [Bacillota bacterium]
MNTRQPMCPGGIPYTIRSGDTFYSIARRYGVSLDDLLEANPGVDPDSLRVGQIICVPGVSPEQCEPGQRPYVIQRGDTFYSIAQRFDITVQDLIDANPAVDPNRLQIGQTICLPMDGPQPICPAGTFPYFVRSGDTFYSLAQRYNTTVDAIAAANPGVDPNRLRIGQRICIPEDGPLPTCPRGTLPYVIKAGDTFYSLAQRYNTTVDAIQRANPNVDPNRLRVGQTICIPGMPGPGPGPGPCPTGTFAYRVRPGDTFYRLAMRYNTTVDAIADANPDVDPNRLRVGQTICIPRV